MQNTHFICKLHLTNQTDMCILSSFRAEHLPTVSYVKDNILKINKIAALTGGHNKIFSALTTLQPRRD